MLPASSGSGLVFFPQDHDKFQFRENTLFEIFWWIRFSWWPMNSWTWNTIIWLPRQGRYFPNVVVINIYQHENPIRTIFVYWHMNNHNDLLNPGTQKKGLFWRWLWLAIIWLPSLVMSPQGGVTIPWSPDLHTHVDAATVLQLFTCALANSLTTT